MRNAHSTGWSRATPAASGVARLAYRTRGPDTPRPPRSCTGTPPMAKSPKVRPHALRLSSYGELEAYVRAFAAGHLHLLLLFGPPGVGKSRAVRQALDSQVGWISGQATPLGIYLQAFAYRHQPLVLDDIDGLYADRSGIRLLKALCQTEPVKTLGWHTLTPILELHDVPTQFSTTSRLALIGNDWKTLNADVAALLGTGRAMRASSVFMCSHTLCAIRNSGSLSVC